jgi:hypothetical protein
MRLAMMKHLIAGTAAACFWMPQALGQSILQKTDWKETRFETFLPSSDAAVPWLNLNTKTKLPKGDLPIGREAASVGSFVLQPVDPDTRVFSAVPLGLRRM